MPRVDKVTIIRRDDSEILIALKDTHHVLHRIRMRLGQRSVTVPVSNLLQRENRVHHRRVDDIVLQRAGWVLKRVVVMYSAVGLLKFVKELPKSHIDASRPFGKVSEPIVLLTLCIDDLITCRLFEIGLILPLTIGRPYLGIIFE